MLKRGLWVIGLTSTGYIISGIMGTVYFHEGKYSVQVNPCMVNPGGGAFLHDVAGKLEELDTILQSFHFPPEYIFACIDADREMEKL